MSHFEPLRPNRFSITEERYEFAHGKDSICVYDIHTLQFIKEIPVGNTPDCHATTCSNRYLYVACLDGLYIIDQNSLTVSRVLQTGPVYATNSLPDGKIMLVHDTRGAFWSSAILRIWRRYISISGWIFSMMRQHRGRASRLVERETFCVAAQSIWSLVGTVAKFLRLILKMTTHGNFLCQNSLNSMLVTTL